MKFYFAGNLEVRREELFFSSNKRQRLVSYHYYKEEYIKSFGVIMQNKNISIFLDSGAFSAWSKGINIDIQEYISFIKKNKKYLDVYSVLDSIGDAEKTLENQKIMEDAGLDPLPCFHYGENIKYLKHYIDNYDYVALGGMVPISNNDLVVWLDDIFENYICDDNGLPRCKIHGFGMTAFRLMRRYPWWSTDSTSWIMSSRTGTIFIPPKINNEFIYNKDPWKICISEKSNKISDAGQHIGNLPQNIISILNEYIELKGFTIEELSKEYVKRDLINLEYFKDFEKAQPKWPWKFKKKGIKGFFK